MLTSLPSNRYSTPTLPLTVVSTMALPLKERQTTEKTTRKSASSPLKFVPLTINAIPSLRPYMEAATSRTCDYSIGGLVMWAGYFDYSYAIYRDTLFIKGVTEDDITRPAFSFPVGALPVEESVRLLKEYCRANEGLPLVFSAVPEEAVETLRRLGAVNVTELEDWGDYLYRASDLATLSGKKLGKKRNHVNRFMIEHPDYVFEPLNADNLQVVKDFYRASHLDDSKPALADIEREQVFEVLDNLDRYPFEGAVLSTPDLGVVAFTLGEVIGDTLYTHIEKMDHTVNGAGETINKLFAGMMTARYPFLDYINREEDTGDPGLRHAKESYHPAMILRKYNVTL